MKQRSRFGRRKSDKRVWVIMALAIVALVVTYSVSCDKSSGPTSPAPVSAPPAPSGDQLVVPPAAPAEPVVVETDPCEGDASCGKGLKAKFEADLSFVIESTNTGHGNSGVVCATDGFQGPPLPGTPYPWSVKPLSTSTTPFPIDKIAEALTWEEGQCKQEINVQMDGFRGPQCTGHILAVVWPQDNKVVFERPGGAWIEEKPIVVEGEWGECQIPTDAGPSASTDQPDCRRQKKIVTTIWERNICEEDRRIKSERTTYKTEACDCPCIERWEPLKEPVIERGEWSECRASRDNETLEQTLSADIASCKPDKCYGERFRVDVLTWYEKSTCTDKRRKVRTERKTFSEKCEMECPYVEGVCFYNISRQPKALTCRTKLGGNPLRLGEWGRWPDGPPSDHCRFSVPGIHTDLFGQFQLTPGQSDPRCNRR